MRSISLTASITFFSLLLSMVAVPDSENTLQAFDKVAVDVAGPFW